MIDKLQDYKQALGEFHELVRSLGSSENVVASSEKVAKASNILLDEIVAVVGRLDVALAEIEPAPAATGFVDQHGKVSS